MQSKGTYSLTLDILVMQAWGAEHVYSLSVDILVMQPWMQSMCLCTLSP